MSGAFTEDELAAACATAREADTGYRRGYCHGYSQAMDDMLTLQRGRECVRPDEAWNILANHYDTKLHQWRRRRIAGWSPPRMPARVESKP